MTLISVDGAFGVAVAWWLVEVVEQLGAPLTVAVGEHIEGGRRGAVAAVRKGLEAPRGLGVITGLIDRSERPL
jgi:hypothetical protein